MESAYLLQLFNDWRFADDFVLSEDFANYQPEVVVEDHFIEMRDVE